VRRPVADGEAHGKRPGGRKANLRDFAFARRDGVPAAALKYVSKLGVKKHGEAAKGPEGEKIWTRTGPGNLARDPAGSNS
jgi:hypothetical protein